MIEPECATMKAVKDVKFCVAGLQSHAIAVT